MCGDFTSPFRQDGKGHRLLSRLMAVIGDACRSPGELAAFAGGQPRRSAWQSPRRWTASIRRWSQRPWDPVPAPDDQFGSDSLTKRSEEQSSRSNWTRKRPVALVAVDPKDLPERSPDAENFDRRCVKVERNSVRA